MKHDPDQFHDLPSPLPAGERLIWQGRPTFRGLALRAFHIREIAVYFGLILMWRLWSSWSSGASFADAAVSALWLIVPALSGIAILAGLAWLFRRASQYTITSKRVLLQFGVALPMTMNIPLTQITNAALRSYADGSGDIPLKLTDGSKTSGSKASGVKASFLLLWPHIRPWRLRLAEPKLRSIPDAAQVAAKLAEALSGRPGPIAVSMTSFVNNNRSSGVVPGPETTVAA